MKGKHEHSMMNFIGIPDVITLAGLFMAIGSMFASLTDRLYLAAALIFGSVVCDFFDGQVARRLNRTGNFGVAMDGFNDFATHLLAVVIFTYSAGLTSPLAILCYILFVSLGTMRLARFSITGTVDGYYEGLPVSYSFVLVPLCLLFRRFGLPLQPLLLVYVLPAFLMVSCVKVKKPFYKTEAKDAAQ